MPTHPAVRKSNRLFLNRLAVTLFAYTTWYNIKWFLDHPDFTFGDGLDTVYLLGTIFTNLATIILLITGFIGDFPVVDYVCGGFFLLGGLLYYVAGSVFPSLSLFLVPTTTYSSKHSILPHPFPAPLLSLSQLTPTSPALSFTHLNQPLPWLSCVRTSRNPSPLITFTWQ